MSASGREVAHRLFAAEYDDATYSYSESDEERAPNYVVTPTGARVNRLFFVGVLTEVERVSDDVLRARVVDPTGAFVVYAGQYQPDEMAFLEDAEPPMFVAVTGKARTFSPDDSDQVFTSVRPESINEVDADTRDRWTVQAAEATLARVATFRAALDLDLAGDRLRTALRESGVTEGVAAGIPVALEQYGTTEHYLAAVADVALDALELVAGTADEVSTPSITPGDAGDGTVDAVALVAGLDDAVVDLDADGAAEPSERDDANDGALDGRAETETTGNGPTDADESAGAGSGDEPAETPGEPETPEQTGTADEKASTGEAETVEETETADETPTAEEPETGDRTDAADGTEGAPSDEDEEPDDELGDFEPGGAAADDEVPEDVVDEEERERIEEEFGTDFSTGTEVGEPGEAGIEPEAGPIEPEETGTDEPAASSDDDASATGAEAEEAASGTETAPTDPAADEADDATESDEPADTDDVDLESAALDAMAELDDGDGANREAVVAAVVDEHGVDPGAVEDAIQDALMAGKCYEPDDESVKPI